MKTAEPRRAAFFDALAPNRANGWAGCGFLTLDRWMFMAMEDAATEAAK